MDVEQQAIVQTFLQKAAQAAAEGKDEQARAWLEGVVELDDANIEAWLRLAELVPDARERMYCYAHVLEIAPGNAQAKAGIRRARREL
jgi:thioredoxin-like negative regulator of GroEL